MRSGPARGREKRWVVREGDGITVAEIVTKAGVPDVEGAIAQGRVFVGRVRAKSGAQSVKPGDEVKIGGAEVAPANRAAAPAAPSWSVLWEREGLIACNKPAGIPTVPDHAGAAQSLVALVAESRGKKPGDLYVTSRLDRDVSGVVVFAITTDAEARLRSARAAGRYVRRYVAIAAATSTTLIGLINVDQPRLCGVWNAPIGAGKDPRHRAVSGPEAKAARTHFAVVARAGDFLLLAVEPQTGRTHQIRVHAAHAGAPLLGDRAYGGAARVTLPNGSVVALATGAPAAPRIALHAARVTLPPGTGGAPLVASAPIPVELFRVWAELGGAGEAWDTALSCVIEVPEPD